MPQESFGVLLVNERGKAIDFWAPPDVQLDHILAVVDAPLKRWQIPQSFNRTKNAKPFSKRRRADLFRKQNQTDETTITNLGGSTPTRIFSSPEPSRRGE
jgi:hypothetical protein